MVVGFQVQGDTLAEGDWDWEVCFGLHCFD